MLVDDPTCLFFSAAKAPLLAHQPLLLPDVIDLVARHVAVVLPLLLPLTR